MLMLFRADRKNKNVVLLGQSLSQDEDGGEISLDELLDTDPDLVPDASEWVIESRRAIMLMERLLEDREREVVRLRYGLEYGEPWPKHRVAEKLGISRSYVYRIEKRRWEK